MIIPEEQFKKLYQILEAVSPERGNMGRPRKDDRKILAGVLWVLKTGARWCDLPKEYPSYQTCHRRFQEWVREGTFQSLLAYIAKECEGLGIDLSECFIDGSFAVAKKGVLQSEKLNGARAPRSWPLPMLPVYLSPLLWQALRPTKSRLWRKR